MSLFPPTDDDLDRLREINELFVSGAMLLQGMLFKKDPTTFKLWANRLREGASTEEGIATNERLKWLWDALRTEPELKQKFGMLPPAAAPWAGTKERFEIFGPKEWFVIGLKSEAVVELMKYPHRSPSEETVCVQTLDVLRMEPKGKRLKCCDCRADVTIRVGKVYTVAREADLMEVKEDRISLGDHFLKVRVDSLNHAYTVSSRRLEPDRRAHGGSTYDHIVHVGQGTRTPLETIRLQVENGDWKVPSSAAPEGTVLSKDSQLPR